MVIVANSGYGIFMRDLGRRLRDDGWQIAFSCFYGLDSYPIEWEGIKCYPKMADPWGADAMVHHARDFKAHVVMSMQDIWVLKPEFLKQIKTFIPYMPIDKDPAPPNVLNNLKYAYKILTFCEFGKKTLEDAGFSSTKIYEGTDLNIFKPLDKKQCRKELNLPEDAFIFGMVGANKENPPRKGYQEGMQAFKMFHDKHPESRIFFHTQQKSPSRFPIIGFAKHLGIANKTFIMSGYKGTYGSSSDVINKEYNAFDVLLHPSQTEGFGLCLHPETKILTKQGLKPIYNVEIGNEVITHSGEYRRVSKTMSRSIDDGLIKIGIYGIPEPILATKEHPLWAVSRVGSKIKLTDPKWIAAEKLKKGDLVAFSLPEPSYSNVVFDLADFDSDLLKSDYRVWYKMGYSGKNGLLKKYKRPVPLNNEVSKLIGIYIAEGSTNRNQMSSIEFSLGKEPELAKEIASWLLKYFGVKALIINMDTKIRLVASGRILAKFFSTLVGMGAKNKKIPTEILLNKDKSILKDCIEYLGIGDGWEDQNGRLRFHLGSEALTKDVYLASLLLGWKVSCQKAKTGNYHSFIAQHSGRKHSNKNWQKDNIVYTLIKSITKIPYSGDVFNLEVEKEHSYQVWGGTVHNCIIESQSAGTPVIVQNSQSQPELIKEGKTGWLAKTAYKRFSTDMSWVHIADVQSIYEQMEKAYKALKKNPEKIAKDCRKNIADNFNIDTIAKEHWIPLLEELQEELLPKN